MNIDWMRQKLEDFLAPIAGATKGTARSAIGLGDM
jgi:hypothetical protein